MSRAVIFDVGGVLSKHPRIFSELFRALQPPWPQRATGTTRWVEVHVISDMHPVEKILDMLSRNDLDVHPSRSRGIPFEETP